MGYKFVKSRTLTRINQLTHNRSQKLTGGPHWGVDEREGDMEWPHSFSETKETQIYFSD